MYKALGLTLSTAAIGLVAFLLTVPVQAEDGPGVGAAAMEDCNALLDYVDDLPPKQPIEDAIKHTHSFPLPPSESSAANSTAESLRR